MNKKVLKILISGIIVAAIATVFIFSGKHVPFNRSSSLSQKEMREDFDLLWNTLKENYPYWGVLDRKGIDMDKRYNNYKKRISNCKTNLEFYRLLNNFLTFNEPIGHLDLVSPEVYKHMYNSYKDIAVSPEYSGIYAQWTSVFLSEDLRKSYENWNEILNDDLKTKKAFKQSNDTKDNVFIKILKENEVAYLRIDSFSNKCMDEDINKLIEFYKSIRNYTDLIIDVSYNFGGSDMYWVENIVSPNISKPMEYSHYSLFKNGDNNMKFLKNRLDSDYKVCSISELPNFENINKKDLKKFDSFYVSKNDITPKNDEKIFQGKIWVISSPDVYSASDAFLSFCKQTKFATIVGQKSGGDGPGIEPVYIVLPNSMLAVQYSCSYELNCDGSCNEEFGTSPDIKTLPDQAVEYILQSIDKRGTH